MKKLKNEGALFKQAIKVGTVYLNKRGAGQFDANDSSDFKAKAIYTLLVMDKLVQPLPGDQETNQNIRHKLAIWLSHQLPADHPLMK